jgi:hypothetical protein
METKVHPTKYLLINKITDFGGKLKLIQKLRSLYKIKKFLVFLCDFRQKIYGPYYFVEKVNGSNYLDMLKNCFWPKHLRSDNYKNYYFQQDGATIHTTNVVQSWLSGKFGEKFIDSPKVPRPKPMRLFFM